MDLHPSHTLLPGRIGNMEISFFSTPFVSLNGGSLVLPEHIHEAHPLKGGSQYLVRTPPLNLNRNVVSHYFFGIDDTPFLTTISKRRFDIFKVNGEQAFYESLVPKSIKLMAESNPDQMKRQGDIWAIKVADTWSQVAQAVGGYQVAPKSAAKKWRAYQERLFDSRHELTGDIVSGRFIITEVVPKKRIAQNGRGAAFNTKGLPLTLATGYITAPDHPNLFLDDGIYVVDRTTGQVEASSGMD